MLISIIVPVYKVEQYIAKCIESVKNQTFQDFECIVVDDGSPDQSIEIARKVVGDDNRFIFVTKENGGLSSARNFGLKFAKGEYVAFLDSDDWFENDFLEVMLDNIADCDICCCNIKYINENNSLLYFMDNRVYGEIEAKKCFPIILEGIDIYHSAGNKIYKKELFLDIKYPEGMVYEDLATTYKLFYKSKKIKFIEDRLYNYLQRKNSIMNTYNMKDINDRINALMSIKSFLVNKSIFNKFMAEYEISYLCHVVNGGSVNIMKYSPKWRSDIKVFLSIIDKEIFTYKTIIKLFNKSRKHFLLLFFLKINPFFTKIILNINNVYRSLK